VLEHGLNHESLLFIQGVIWFSLLTFHNLVALEMGHHVVYYRVILEAFHYYSPSTHVLQLY
jgi:hypothetical protein